MAPQTGGTDRDAGTCPGSRRKPAVTRDAELRSPASQGNSRISLWGQPSFFNLRTPNFKPGHVQTGTHAHTCDRSDVSSRQPHSLMGPSDTCCAAACCFPRTLLPQTTASMPRAVCFAADWHRGRRPRLPWKPHLCSGPAEGQAAGYLRLRSLSGWRRPSKCENLRGPKWTRPRKNKSPAPAQ